MHRHVAGISSWQRRCLAAAGKTNAHHMNTKHHTRTAVLKLQHPRGEVPPQRESMTNAGTAHPRTESGTMIDAHYQPLSILPSLRPDPSSRVFQVPPRRKISSEPLLFYLAVSSKDKR